MHQSKDFTKAPAASTLPRVILYCAILASVWQIFGTNPVRAQFWAALPKVVPNSLNTSISFSQDEKWVYYTGGVSGGKENIFRVSIKGGAPIQVTKFTDANVIRAFHCLGRPYVVYMKGKSDADTDYHLYRVNDDGSGDPLDLTPSGPGTQNTLIGESYNGRYMYYTANKESLTKLDCYRYDVQQNVSDLVFPNDKDWKVLAWSRDNAKLLMEDPSTEQVSLFDIVSTDYQKLAMPAAGSHVLEALLTPDNHQLGVLESTGGSVQEKWTDVGTSSWNTAMTSASHIDFSTNGKFKIAMTVTGETISEAATKQPIGLPANTRDIAVSPKEGLIAFVMSNDGNINILKLELYDVAKKTTTELVPDTHQQK
jgi:Tol biopolymer transport system component